jgi:hypothetical protein
MERVTATAAPRLLGRTSPWVAIVLAGAISACASYSDEPTPEAQRADWEARNAYPQNYKSEVVSYMRIYLNDPGSIRDAFISPPELKPMGLGNRFMSCLRFGSMNPSAGAGNGTDHVVVFVGGKLDSFREAKGQCANAAYAPFPELEHMTR